MKRKKTSKVPAAPKYHFIVAWQNALIPWFWGGSSGWGGPDRAVFFMRAEDARHECRQIRTSPSTDAALPIVEESSEFNRRHGRNVAPPKELVK